MCRFFMCAEHGTNQSPNGKRKPIPAPKISLKKNNEEVANIYLTQTSRAFCAENPLILFLCRKEYNHLLYLVVSFKVFSNIQLSNSRQSAEYILTVFLVEFIINASV